LNVLDAERRRRERYRPIAVLVFRTPTIQEISIMIKDLGLLEKFEREELKKENLDYRSALRIFEGMWLEGMALGVLPLKDPLEEIEVDIRIARMLNHV
jgi:hypothetical protein